MNTVCLVGRLTRDPELRVTPSGTSVAQFTLTVDRAGDRQDDGSYAAGFFDCEAWDKTAELIEQYLGKGRQCGIEGRLKLHKWQAQDGTNRSKVEIVVSRMTFVGSKNDGNNSGEFAPSATEGIDADADIPF